jgi:hypothetical protein
MANLVAVQSHRSLKIAAGSGPRSFSATVVSLLLPEACLSASGAVVSVEGMVYLPRGDYLSAFGRQRRQGFCDGYRVLSDKVP